MVGVIAHKALRLSLHGRGVTVGRVVSLATNDVEKFQIAGWSVHYLWAGPLEAAAVLIVGCFILGPAFIGTRGQGTSFIFF